MQAMLEDIDVVPSTAVLRPISTAIFSANISRDQFLPGSLQHFNSVGIAPCNSYSLALSTLIEQRVYRDDVERLQLAVSRQRLLSGFAHQDYSAECEFRLINEQGEQHWMEMAMQLQAEGPGGDVICHGYLRNIDERKHAEHTLLYQSQHDGLTGTLNKHTLEASIDALLADSYDPVGVHAFFIMDIDHFKAVNDSFGHAFGDMVISETARKLRGLFRDTDILGRIGGDEFVALMRHPGSEAAAVDRAEKIRATIRETYFRAGAELVISLSIGLAFCGRDGRNFATLYRHSDAALYQAKLLGRDRVVVYDRGYRVAGKVTAIDTNRHFAPRSFSDNVTEYVLRMIYDASDAEATINAILKLIGKHYGIDRVYIFQDSPAGDYMYNTYEWCAEGIEPQIDVLQHLSYLDLGGYHASFDKDGVWHLPDVRSIATDELRGVLERQGIKSMLQFSILQNRRWVGFVGYDQCAKVRIPTPDEISDLRNVANILGLYLFGIANKAHATYARITACAG